MKKLKNKVFLVIFLIFTIFTTGILFAYNFTLYNQEKRSIERSLNQTTQMEIMAFPPNNGGFKKPDSSSFDNIRFLDRSVYTVILDENDEITGVINHSNYDVSDDEIEEVAVTMISQSYQKEIGNLYFANYSYSYKPSTSIVIVDNSSVKQLLTTTLLVSVLLYLIAELIILLISKRLTLWIAKPVAESFDKQKRFIADASHELKTPLSVIIASADALESNPEEKKWLENIKSEGDRMNALIADLLELAKSEEVNDISAFTQGNLSKLVEKATLTFESVMFEKGVTLSDSIQDNIMLNMNESKIQQLISILLDNAIKHSESGSEISVELKQDKDIILTVTNKGEGIPKGEEEKIFERFYRADESRNRNDNRYGLGLAIAKNIVISHGGTISAKSENGYTTFKAIFKVK